MTSDVSLLLVDGLNLLRPVFEVNKEEDPERKKEGVLRSLHASFLRALDTHRPTHCLWCFESRAHTWRHALYPQYKANRPEPPALLLDVVATFRAQLAEQGIASCDYAGLEADDVLGCVAFRARKANLNVIALCTDKDITTLLGIGVQIYNHFDKSWRDDAWLQRKLGVTAAQVPDYLALAGDADDNIPGVTRVGPKTAAQLLGQFETLDGVLTAAEQGLIPGQVGRNLVAEKENALLFKQLTTLKYDCITDSLKLKDYRL